MRVTRIKENHNKKRYNIKDFADPNSPKIDIEINVVVIEILAYLIALGDSKLIHFIQSDNNSN